MFHNSVMFVAIAIALCLSVTVSANGGKPSGNNNVRSKALGTTYQVDGDRNIASASATSDAIARAFESGKAFMASELGTKAALSTADRAVSIKAFDSLGNGGRKLFGRKLSQSAVVDSGDRISMAIQSAHSAIDRAVTRATAGASKAATKNSLAFAKLSISQSTRADQIEDGGHRKLQQGATNDRSDRTIMSELAASELIEKAVTSKDSTAGAVKKAISYAKLAASQSARPADFLP